MVSNVETGNDKRRPHGPPSGGIGLALASLLAVAACVEAPAPRAAPPGGCDARPLLLQNFTLPDTGGKHSLLIADGRIVWTAPVGEHPRVTADDVTTLDANGMTALPGLIDSHTHLDVLPAAKHLQRTLDATSDILPMTMRQTLASGVTTTRVHLARVESFPLLRAATDDDCFPAPRIALSGPGLQGGTPDLDAPLMKGAAGVADIRAKISALADQNVEWLALHELQSFSDEELGAALDTAAAAGIRLMADAGRVDDLRIAIASPVTSAEYLDLSPAPRYPATVIDALRARRAPLYLCAPLGYYARMHDHSRAGSPPLPDSVFTFVEPELERQMRSSFAEVFATDAYIRATIDSFPTHAAKFAQLREAGARAVVCSDSGSVGQFHHDALWHELAAWYRHGVPVDEILAAATRVPAQMLGRSAEVGALASGLRGDVVLYAGDVAAGEFDRRHVATVIKGGVVFVHDYRWTGPPR